MTLLCMARNKDETNFRMKYDKDETKIRMGLHHMIENLQNESNKEHT